MSGVDVRNLSPTVGAALRCTAIVRLAAGLVSGPNAKRELLRLCARIGYTPH